VTDRTRASDAEREHVVGLLRTAAAHGRLTVEELEARTAAAYAAAIRGEPGWAVASPARICSPRSTTRPTG
jgi:Domain of unknown function (DUF1707)